MRDAVKNMKLIGWGTTPKDALVLKWGENLYPPSQNIVNAICRSAGSVNLYPDPFKSELMDELQRYTGLNRENILITNGADKAFRLIAETFVEPGIRCVTFTPSYPVFDIVVKLMGGKLIEVPLDLDFKINTVPRADILYICNPNNPTSNLVIDTDKLFEILDSGVLVVLDEAYYEFSGVTYSNLVNDYDNLIILRSFSKGFGLAGLRVGYVLASRQTIRSMKKVEDNMEIFNVSAPSLAGAAAALQDIDYMRSNIKKIESTKKRFMRELDLDFVDSKTSFLFFSLDRIRAQEFVDMMKRKNIILKDCSIYSGLGPNWVYMAVPKSKDEDFVIKAIKEVLK